MRWKFRVTLKKLVLPAGPDMLARLLLIPAASKRFLTSCSASETLASDHPPTTKQRSCSGSRGVSWGKAPGLLRGLRGLMLPSLLPRGVSGALGGVMDLDLRSSSTTAFSSAVMRSRAASWLSSCSLAVASKCAIRVSCCATLLPNWTQYSCVRSLFKCNPLRDSVRPLSQSGCSCPGRGKAANTPGLPGGPAWGGFSPRGALTAPAWTSAQAFSSSSSSCVRSNTWCVFTLSFGPGGAMGESSWVADSFGSSLIFLASGACLLISVSEESTLC